MEVAFAQLLADRFLVFSSVDHFPRSLLSELPEQMWGECSVNLRKLFYGLKPLQIQYVPY